MSRQRLVLTALAAMAIVVLLMPDPILYRPTRSSPPSSSSQDPVTTHSKLSSLSVFSEDAHATLMGYSKSYDDHRNYEHEGIVCAPDYHSCGSLPAPTSSLPCCNPQSYCYRRPPYFSQCRPRDELANSRMTQLDHPHAVRQCATVWVRCSNVVACCNSSHQCITIAPSYTVCVSSSSLQFLHALLYTPRPDRVDQV